jgi:hypothetical protein
MTEVRRQRRSKAKINAETRRQRTTRLISSEANGAAAKDTPPSTSDDIHETSSSLAEPLAASLTEINGSQEFQYSFHFQEEGEVNTYSFDAAVTIPEEPMLVVDLARGGTVHSDALAIDEVIQYDAPIYSRYDQMEETVPTPTILGISRIDPFRALPVPPDQDTYQLLDHCKFLSNRYILAAIAGEFRQFCPNKCHRYFHNPIPDVWHSQSESGPSSALQLCNPRSRSIPRSTCLFGSTT